MPAGFDAYWYSKYVGKIKKWRRQGRRAWQRRHALARGFQIARATNRWASGVWEQPYIPRGGVVTPEQVYHTTHWGEGVGSWQPSRQWQEAYSNINIRNGGTSGWSPNWIRYWATKPTQDAAKRWSEQEADRRNTNYAREIKQREKALERIGEAGTWKHMLKRTADAALETAGAVASIVAAYNS